MRLPRMVVWMSMAGTAALGANTACGQNYPIRPIRILTATPGGNGDFAARQIVQEIAGPMGQNISVDNRTAPLAASIVAGSQPDGYSLLVAGSDLWIEQLLHKTPYDLKELAPISLLVRSPNVLVVHPSLAAKSVRELIDMAKTRPGALNYAGSTIGGTNHVAAELFKFMAGVNLVYIPYKGSNLALVALLGGETQVMFPNAASVTPHLKSGKLRALAVTSAEPSALVPGLPAVSATVPGYSSEGMTGMFARAGTPATIISRLHHEIARIMSRTDVKERFLNTGVETVGSSPEQLAATIKSDSARMEKLIKDVGVRID